MVYSFQWSKFFTVIIYVRFKIQNDYKKVETLVFFLDNMNIVY